MKQKYICKCGRTFEKQGDSDTTGFRLGPDFGSQNDCFGCPFVLPIEKGYPDPKIVDYECRASRKINYATTADLPRSRDGFHVGRIHTLDLKFANDIWNFSRGLDGLDDHQDVIDSRGACFGADGRYCLTLYFTKTKAGVASSVAVSDKFFAGDTARPHMTAEQEKQIVLQQIAQAKRAAKGTDLRSAESNETTVTHLAGRSVDQITLEINFYKAQTAQNIIEIGKRLIEAKQQLQHGEWLPWLRDKVQFTERSAQNFMRIAQEFSNTKTLADLPYTKLLTLLQVPEGDRDEFIQKSHLIDGQEKAVKDMSTRELQQAIKERDEARSQKDEAERKAFAAVAEKAKLDAKLRDAKCDSDRNYRDYMNAAVKLEKEQQRAETLLSQVQAHSDKVSDLERKIKELESRPIDVAVQQPSESEQQQLRDEGAELARRQYEQQLTDAREELEQEKATVRAEIGLSEDEVKQAGENFRDSLDSLYASFQIILRLSPPAAMDSAVVSSCSFMRRIISDMEKKAAEAENIALRDKNFNLPPEDGKEA